MTHDSPLFRVDKFVVPQEARDAFLEKVRETHAILSRQPGFLRDLLLEQYAGPGKFNIVTLVEWQNEAANAAARTAVEAARADTGFDPQAFMARLNIEADMANYRSISH